LTAGLTNVFFTGSAPFTDSSLFCQASDATVYYLPGTTGWGATFGGCPTALWNPQSEFNYTISNGAITITGYTGPGGAVAIPSAINGLPVTGIGVGAFYWSTNLTSVTIPNGVTTIGHHAFYYCTSLTGFTNPSSLTSIGEFAFANCFTLASVSPFPASVTNIGIGSFAACPVAAFSIDPANASYFTEGGVLFQNNPVVLVQYPDGQPPGAYAIPDGVTEIGGFSFEGSGVAQLTVPASVSSIADAAFAYACLLTNLLCLGNAPVAATDTFSSNNCTDHALPTVYHLAGTAGWGPTFGGAPAIPLEPSAATATASVVNGFVVGATIADRGLGYTNTPTVRIIGGGGSGAQAVAVVSNAVVVAVNVTAAGSGYTSTPIIIIEPPFIPQPTMAISALLFGPLVTPVMQLNLANPSPYDNYQVQFSPAAGGTWTNLGAPFTPTATTSTQYANAIGGTGFFRVKYVP
jgi:hypothetical protein